MEQIHYEKVLNSGLFSVDEVYGELSKELPEEGFPFEQFIQTDIMGHMQNRLGTLFSEMDVASVCQLLFHMYSFHVCHGRVYEVSDNIAEMLLNTRLNVDVSLLKSPMSEIIILIPEDLLQIHNKVTGLHNVYTIYVNLHEISDTCKIIKALCVGRPNKKSLTELDDAFFYFRYDLSAGKVSDSIKRTMLKPDRPSRWVDPKDVASIPRISQMIFNTMLYVTSKDCDIRINRTRYAEMERKIEGLKSKGKVKKLSNRLMKESKINRYMVGDTIQLSTEEKNLYKAVRGKLKIRFRVGGHWREQWYGSVGKKYQKQKWIRPYFKGPELAELIKSVGVLK